MTEDDVLAFQRMALGLLQRSIAVNLAVLRGEEVPDCAVLSSAVPRTRRPSFTDAPPRPVRERWW